MTYRELGGMLSEAGYFTYYREESRTMICSSAEWSNVPQIANSFWVARRDEDWYVATWSPHVYRLGDGMKVAELCIT